MPPEECKNHQPIVIDKLTHIVGQSTYRTFCSNCEEFEDHRVEEETAPGQVAE